MVSSATLMGPLPAGEDHFERSAGLFLRPSPE